MVMGDINLPDTTEFNEANATHAAAYGAIVIALIDKGILTMEEYNRAYAQATVIVDQEFARKRDNTKLEEKRDERD